MRSPFPPGVPRGSGAAAPRPPGRLFAFDDVERHHARLSERLPATALETARRAACREVALRALPGVAILPAALLACGVLGEQHFVAPRSFALVMVLALLAAALRLAAIRRFLAPGPLPDARDETRFFLVALLLPGLWGGYSACLLIDVQGGWLGMVLLSFTAAIASSVVIGFGMWARLALTLVTLILVPTLLVGILIDAQLGTSLLFGCITYGIYLALQNHHWNRIFWTSELNAALLAVRSQELARAKDAAERANRAKSEFLTR
ncbi:MAG: hypothetical protein RLW62_10685, partial [Gammaproteobacteria bacterium]